MILEGAWGRSVLTGYFPLDFSNLKISILPLPTQKKSPPKIKVCFLCPLHMEKKTKKTSDSLGLKNLRSNNSCNGPMAPTWQRLRCAVFRKLGIFLAPHRSLPFAPAPYEFFQPEKAPYRHLCSKENLGVWRRKEGSGDLPVVPPIVPPPQKKRPKTSLVRWKKSRHFWKKKCRFSPLSR